MEAKTRKANAREGALRIQRQLIRGEINRDEALLRVFSLLAENVAENSDLLEKVLEQKPKPKPSRSGSYDAARRGRRSD